MSTENVTEVVRWDDVHVHLLTNGAKVVGFVLPRSEETGGLCRRHLMSGIDTIERVLLVQGTTVIGSDGIAVTGGDWNSFCRVVAQARQYPQGMCPDCYAFDYAWLVRVDGSCTCDEVHPRSWARFVRNHPVLLAVLRAQMSALDEAVLRDLVQTAQPDILRLVFKRRSGGQSTVPEKRPKASGSQFTNTEVAM